MRKLLLIVVLLLGAALSVSAIGEAELSALARYVPEDALAYVAIRTDDEFIAAVNALINKGLPYFPPDETPSEVDILELLNAELDNQGLGSFEDSIRPWLGNTAAAAFFAPEDMAGDPDILVILDADGQAALDFAAPLLEDGDFEETSINNMTAYQNDDEFNPVTIAFGDDAIFLSNNEDLIPAGQADSPMSDNAGFTSMLGSLPAEEYVSIIYINTPQINRLILEQMEQSGANYPDYVEEFLNVTGGMAVGFTMLNDEALVMDMVQSIDISAFEDFGVTLANPSALDLSFSNHIPADAVAVLQGSDFGAGVQTAFNNVRAFGEYIKANGGLADWIDPYGYQFTTEEQRHAANQIDLAWIIGSINLSFAGATGLSLENDVLPVLDGDAAAYLRVLPVDDYFSPIIPDGALLFQTSDAAAAEALVNQLTAAATAYDTPVSSEDFGNGVAMVLPASESMGMDYPALDVLIGASDDVIAIGTRGAVEASLNTSGGLADDATFQAAMQYTLSDSQSLAYFTPTPFFNAVDPAIEDGSFYFDDESANAYRLMSLVESATISSRVTADGLSSIRFVISLSDAPRPVPNYPDA
jgi:hypothetical protein